MPNKSVPAAATGLPAAVKDTDAAVAKAMRELENAIRELMHMADITAETYDNMFSPSSRVGGNDGPSLTYRITKHEDDQMAFLVNNVASRCTNLHRSFEAAWKGEVLA